jgi:multicomponent Na+:H+ antiporter subunit E
MKTFRVSGILIWLVVLWVLLWDDVSAANVLSGVVIAVLVLVFAKLPRVNLDADPEHVARVNVPMTIWFGGFFLYKLVEANLLLAWEIVTPKNSINTGMIAVPLRTESKVAMLVVSSVITLTPGTLTIEVVGKPPILYVNVLHLHDIDRVRRDLLKVEELSVRAFGSRSDRAKLAERSVA